MNLRVLDQVIGNKWQSWDMQEQGGLMPGPWLSPCAGVKWHLPEMVEGWQGPGFT